MPNPSPKFNPGDKIIFDPPPGLFAARALRDSHFTVYIVGAYSAQTGTYVVNAPNLAVGNVRMFAQLDLETSFRLADPDEQDLYF
jgi:hypothetical protein